MAFGRKKARVIYTARIHYFGDVEVEAAARRHPDDASSERLEIRACVEAPEPPEVAPGQNALVSLVPLLAPVHLYSNCLASQAAIFPAVDQLERASNEVLKGEKPARALSLKDETITIGGQPEQQEGVEFNIPMPTLIDESEGASKRIQVFNLVGNNKGGVWAHSEAPPEGGQALFANAGLMLLLQQVAHRADYEQTVVPIAAGLGVFATQFRGTDFESTEDAPDLSRQERWGGIAEHLGRDHILGLFMPEIPYAIYGDDPRRFLADYRARRLSQDWPSRQM